jgi:hypothetical protein
MPVLALAVILASVAAAAATVKTWPLRHGETRSATEASQVAVAAPPVAPEPAPRLVRATPEPSPPPAVAAGPAVSQREVVVDDESTLMVRAVRALRRDGDPARAQMLAAQALQRFPHGAQAEEAMALIMEAASARGDASGAQQAASAYLARFGSGRFADRARRILVSPSK